MNLRPNEAQVAELIKNKLLHFFGISPASASDDMFYKASAMVMRDILTVDRTAAQQAAERQDKKQVFYLCMEFLMGRSLKNNLFNTGLEPAFSEALSGFGCALNKLYELEPDAGLGNGGLGRLAACFLDGLASGGHVAKGHSIKYEYGIFKQKLVDGWQTELPDFWLPGGEVWLNPCIDESVQVKFDGHIEEGWDGDYHWVTHADPNIVTAVPYDMMVAGYDGKGVSVLRLWSAKAPGLDMKLFNEGEYIRAMEQNSMAEVISKVLYPADDHIEGKSLRLKQQYFLVSAAIQDIVRTHLRTYGTMSNFPDMAAIHINDTHPALSVPELMRVMMDECGYTWDDSWDIVRRTIAYTNHTVMREALERWPLDLFMARLPRIYQIVKEIDNRFRHEIWELTRDADTVERMAMISGGQVCMANLSVLGSHKVNGVSRLHSEILKQTVFHDFYKLTPDKFVSVTNGIAHRRWLCQANPMLSEFIEELIGGGFKSDAAQLEGLMKYRDDTSVLDRLAEIKLHNKTRLAAKIKADTGIIVDESSVFDVQVKRLHEYKRQHMNALNILADYIRIKTHGTAGMVPKTYIFGAKAAPGYFVAKQIIQLICKISQMIEADPVAREFIKVVYMEDYSVTVAELLMPAAEISQQISLGGTEASGTGNMKLMLNGAVTLGTEDGANVEIHEQVGDDNIFIFGLRTDEVEQIRKAGYHPHEYYSHNTELAAAVDMLTGDIAGLSFPNLSNMLLNVDYYMALADFTDYRGAMAAAAAATGDKYRWNAMSLTNIAKSGVFASDRAIADYAAEIWHL